MNISEFKEILDEQIEQEKAILIERAKGYATGGDRLGNFYAGAELNGEHALMYGFGLVTKHIIALRDLIVKINDGQGEFDTRERDKFFEYVLDIRNYMVLLKALYLESSQDL